MLFKALVAKLPTSTDAILKVFDRPLLESTFIVLTAFLQVLSRNLACSLCPL